MNPIERLKAEKNKYISIEATLLFICQKYNCSLEVAAEFLQVKLAEYQKQEGNHGNPDFFGELVGVSMFQSVVSPNIDSLLADIITNKSYAFKPQSIPQSIDAVDDDIPF